MSRRTFSILSIAIRHPRMFSAMHRSAEARSDVRDGNDGQMLPNAAMVAAREMDEIAEQLRVMRGRPVSWPQVDALRQKPATERRQGPRSSRFGELMR